MPVRIELKGEFVATVVDEPDYVIGLELGATMRPPLDRGLWLVRCVGVWSLPYMVEVSQDVELVKRFGGEIGLAVYPYNGRPELEWLGEEVASKDGHRIAAILREGRVERVLLGEGDRIAPEVEAIVASLQGG